MNANDKLNLVFKRIKLLDAPEQQIDLDDPAHRFTVWSGGFVDRLQYCGSRQNLESAWMLASQHVHLKELYIVRGSLDRFGIMSFQRS
jgi:hypothetical protein